MKILTHDRLTNTITHREYTDQGYLRVPGKVARIGVQQYLASELNLTDRAPDEIVNVYRPPDEVFKPESLDSYANADVTDDHPQFMVDSETWRSTSVGHTLGAGRPDGEFVVVDLIIKDKSAIDAIEAGKAELSAGYENEYHREPGTAQDGTPYEFVQRNIRINHVALVDKARAGKEAKLFDKHIDGVIPMSTITLDGKSVKVGDESTAQLIQHSLDANAEKLKEMQDKYEKAMDEAEEMKKQMDEMKAAKDSQEEELEKAKEASSDAAISERLKTVQKVRDTAVKIAGADFSCDSIVPLEIKRAALAKVFPTRDWATQSEHYVAAAWDMAAERPSDLATRHSHDGLSLDLAKLYTGDDGRMKGTAEYENFLSGGKH